MCDQDRWHLSSLECSLGPARLRTKAEGRFDRPGDVTANFGATGLPFSPEMLAVLPPQHQESWHKFSPEGAVDLHGWYRVFDGQPDTSVTVDFRNNAFTFFKFPYRCHSVSGRAVIRPTGECDVAVNGFAGEQPVQLVGRLDRLKPDAAYKFDLAVDNVPLDQRIDAACLMVRVRWRRSLPVAARPMSKPISLAPREQQKAPFMLKPTSTLTICNASGSFIR